MLLDSTRLQVQEETLESEQQVCHVRLLQHQWHVSVTFRPGGQRRGLLLGLIGREEGKVQPGLVHCIQLC